MIIKIIIIALFFSWGYPIVLCAMIAQIVDLIRRIK